MKSTLKKTLLAAFCAALLVCALLALGACSPAEQLPDGSQTANTAGDGSTVATGVCEDGLTWTVYSDGLLRLSGTPSNGKMFEYAQYDEEPAWKAYTDQITCLELSDGITSVSAEAFSGMKKLIWIQFGSGVQQIGDSAFRNCTNLRRVILPASVTTVKANAFNGCYRLYELEMDGVTSVGDAAFANCVSLLSVKIPDTLENKSVAADAFSGCERICEVITPLTNVVVGSAGFGGVAKNALEVHNAASKLNKTTDGFIFWSSRLVGYNGNATAVTIPDEATAIGPYAFYANTAVESITMGAQVTSIGQSAFAKCENLATMTIGAKVNTIGEDIFAGCWNLTDLTFNPANCKNCPENLFRDASRLTNVTLGADMKIVPAGLFRNCTGLKTITLPDNVTEIGARAFENCSSLTEVGTGSQIKKIGESAFRNCIGLKAFDLAKLESVTTVGNYAFAGCRSLVTADLSTVEDVGISAFNGCTSLTGVVIGLNTGLTKDNIFRGCQKLVDVVCNKPSLKLNLKPGNSSYGFVAAYTSFPIGSGESRLKQDANGFLFFTNGSDNYLVGYMGSAKNLVLPAQYNNTSYEVYDHAFDGNLFVESITVSAGVTEIGNAAFANCSALTTVNMAQSGAASIGENAFKDCAKLQNVTMNQTLTSIASHAFSGCTNLGRIAIPASVTNLGEYVFEKSGVTSVNLGSGVTELPAYLFSGCKSLSDVVFAAGITKIGEGTFAGCSGLDTLNLPTSLLEIDKYAFYRCDGLRTLVLPDNLISIGEEAFLGCKRLYSLTVGASVADIGERAFDNCATLVEVIDKSSLALSTDNAGPGLITNRAVTVHTGASVAGTDGSYVYLVLGDKTYLAAYTGNDTVLTLPATLNGASYGIFRYAFYQSKVTEVTIPSGVASIGGSAFKNSALQKVSVPGTVSAIGDEAFSGTPLTSLTLAKGVKTIGTAAFKGCAELREVQLPDSVTTVGVSAFRGCKKLSSVSFGTSPESSRLTTIGAYAFDDCYSLMSITLPKYLTSLGNDWCSDCPKMVEIINLSNITLTKPTAVNQTPWLQNVLNIKTSAASSYISTDSDGFVFYNDKISKKYLIGYVGEKTELELPSRFKGDAYEIYKYAFYGRDDITSIRFSDGVSAIGDCAMTGCTALTSIYMPANLAGNAKVGADVLRDCSANLMVVCGYESAAEIPTSWAAGWNNYSDDKVYDVFYGYTYEQYLTLIGK